MGVVIVDGRKPHSILFELFSDNGQFFNQKMKDLKKVKYLILDMDGCVYHPKYLQTLFGQVSTRMTEFISIKLGIDKIKANKRFKQIIFTNTILL